jgi:hypothetical protein
MGDKQDQPFQLSLNSSLKVDFQGLRVTSDAGLILVRELDERLGFGDLIAQHLTDLRHGKNTQLPLADLLRQSVYSRIAGYKDWQLVLDEPPAAAGENGREAGETRPLLLALLGGGPSEQAALRSDAPRDCYFTAAEWVGRGYAAGISIQIHQGRTGT